MGSIADEQELWASYRLDNNRAAQEELFFRYAPWARSVARDVYRRIQVSQVEWGDYAHNATVGLLEAMSRFDASRGVDFIGYAKARVRGAVFNGLRSFLAEVGRRDVSSRMADRLDSLDGGYEDDVLGQIISSVTGLGLGFLFDSAAADGYPSGQDPCATAERHQMERVLESHLARLPEKERMVLTLHYYQYVPFVEIAALLGVSKGRISQIHRAAVERIRAEMHSPQARSRDA